MKNKDIPKRKDVVKIEEWMPCVMNPNTGFWEEQEAKNYYGVVRYVVNGPMGRCYWVDTTEGKEVHGFNATKVESEKMQEKIRHKVYMDIPNRTKAKKELQKEAYEKIQKYKKRMKNLKNILIKNI